MHWSAGEFRPSLTAAIRRPGGIDLASACNRTFVSGTYLPLPGHWADRPECPAWWPNCQIGDPIRFKNLSLWNSHPCSIYMPEPGELLHMLSGQTLVIQGDNMFRQLFMRLITYIRGGTVHFDRCHLQRSVVYTFDSNHDSFSVLKEEKSLLQLPAVQRTQARIVFIWSPRDIAMQALSAIRPRYLVYGTMYAYNDDNDVPYEWIRHVNALNKFGMHLFYVSTPPVVVTPGQQMRNFEMYRVLHGSSEFVPFHEIAERSPYPRFDQAYYSCMYTPSCDVQLNGNFPSPRMHSEKCFDPVNLSAWRLILSVAYKRHVLRAMRQQSHRRHLLHRSLWHLL